MTNCSFVFARDSLPRISTNAAYAIIVFIKGAWEEVRIA